MSGGLENFHKKHKNRGKTELNTGQLEKVLKDFFIELPKLWSKLINGGVLIRSGGLENFRKINKRGGGRLLGT